MPHSPLDDAALDQLFRAARTFASTHDTWLDRPVSTDQIEQIWALARLGPTQTNTVPARVAWVVSAEAKARLIPLMDEGNRDKTLTAPVTAIIGADLDFHEKLPYLYPHADARAWFEGAPEQAALLTAWRNSSLQGAYLILAARALGLDCGPMSGFDADKVTAEFFPGTRIRANFMCNIGYGNRASLRPRNPRLPFDEACRIL
ncbi:MAG TPA: malonic semialdehyde reductase [Chiayiivirga sp.]|jgi:3-hydroxypropanoate dehydrogenase|uniref:Putative NADH dehydrogenase/NAD(P)H nitroreductase WB794_10980 n=1 Tax=Denitratimonas tolerans TaxID=1338420 RepID=A0AAW9R483_9GAMM|nr:malonic semialdehyde reductase [Chiayiivirga sp.]HRN60015.1 malonic semialdehyde reductase [Chiayiivirga sp.]HRQ35561.1 malonic semialdehyde reductase [Chiayiivirga sp.]